MLTLAKGALGAAALTFRKGKEKKKKGKKNLGKRTKAFIGCAY